jgi:hypothetical protein
MIDKDHNFETIYSDKFLPAIDELIKNKENSYLFRPTTNTDDTFWSISSPLIWIPRNIADKYYILFLLKDIEKPFLWNDTSNLKNKNRFQRPINESDFWTFEYDIEAKVWRPYPLQIDRKFPDVYLLKDGSELIPSLNRIFKAFFFYSDTINVRDEYNDIIKSTTSWDEDVLSYYYEPAGTYRDIFIEKFYWMAIKSIYNGILEINSRWEVVEYILNNQAYERFNELFIRTIDPYFKLGLATYLKSENFEFPFDDAIDKLKESMNLNWNGFRKVTNFEVYLNKSWKQSYFDYTIKIMSDTNYDNRILRRPDKTFDIRRFQDILIDVTKDTLRVIDINIYNLQTVISTLVTNDYHLNVSLLNELLKEIRDIGNRLKVKVLDFITNLDMNLYSIDDLKYLIDEINGYNMSIEYLLKLFKEAEEDTLDRNIYESKREILKQLSGDLILIEKVVNEVLVILESFNMNEFMNIVNDLRSYISGNSINPDDNSLINEINKFNDPWGTDVKEKRNL